MKNCAPGALVDFHTAIDGPHQTLAARAFDGLELAAPFDEGHRVCADAGEAEALVAGHRLGRAARVPFLFCCVARASGAAQARRGRPLFASWLRPGVVPARSSGA